MKAVTWLAVVCLAIASAGCDGSPVDVATGGDVQRGAEVIGQAACGSCHTIPGIRSAHGVVAASLASFSRRTFIAGELPNTPANLVRWIKDPPAVEPGTAMPNLGLSDQQARDAAAYLYTLR